MKETKRKRYVLLERDGVINRRGRCGTVTSWEQFDFLPRALDALRLLAENGCTTLILSNQAAVSQGHPSTRDLDAVMQRFLLEVALSGGNIQQVYYCRHAPEDLCDCHMPGSGLLRRAQVEHHFAFENAFLVDDLPAGLRAAERVGCPSILIRREAFLEHSRDRQQPPRVACSLYEAAEWILAAPEIHQRAPMLLGA